MLKMNYKGYTILVSENIVKQFVKITIFKNNRLLEIRRIKPTDSLDDVKRLSVKFIKEYNRKDV